MHLTDELSCLAWIHDALECGRHSWATACFDLCSAQQQPALLRVCKAETTVHASSAAALFSNIQALHCALLCVLLAAANTTGAASAADLLAQEAAPAGAAASNSSSSSSKGRRRISTSCAALDALLGGGGVACGTVTEFCKQAASRAHWQQLPCTAKTYSWQHPQAPQRSVLLHSICA